MKSSAADTAQPNETQPLFKTAAAIRVARYRLVDRFM